MSAKGAYGGPVGGADQHLSGLRAAVRAVGQQVDRLYASTGLGRDGTRRVLQLLGAFVALSVLAGVVGSGLAMPIVSAGNAAVQGGVTFFDSLPGELAQTPMPQTSVLQSADGRPIAYFYDENRTEVPLSKVSPFMQAAIIAIEDSRFFEHGGIDPRGVVRALINNEAGRSIQGASTLTQQYVKNVLVQKALARGDTAAARQAVAKNSARKLREMKLAISLEQRLPKREILQRYLNIAAFGEQTNGAEAASRQYFGIPAAKLDLSQAATLAGMVQEPSTYNPRRHPNEARQRRDVVLARMLQLRMITPEQYEAARKAEIEVRGVPLPNGCANAGSYGFFCDYVVQTILRDDAFRSLGATAADRRATLLRGGLVIRTTLETRLERAATRAVNATVPPRDRSGLGAAAVTVEPRTGNIVAMTQNRVYSVTAGRGRTSVNYSTDSADGGSSGFQTGSSFKPFTLATWLSSGKSLGDSVNATKRAFPFSSFTACGDRLHAQKPYAPGNSEGHEAGKMSVLSATYNSVNVAYVDMESRLDLCDIARTAERLGVHVAAPERECSRDGKATTKLPTCLPSLTLGVKNIAPLTMAAAYAGFASGGIYCAPRAITSIAKPGGAPEEWVPLVTPARSCRRALTKGVASDVNTALQAVLEKGTAARIGPLRPWPSAGKTGTTDGPYDSWFVGYTAQRSTAVWVADPGRNIDGQMVRRRLTGVQVDGRHYGTVYGATIAAPIWKDVMNAAMENKRAVRLP